MIQKLTDQVWWGNWEAPFECLGQVGCIINVAHNFSRRRGRHVYWERLIELPHDVFYHRLALPDRADVSDGYMNALGMAVRGAISCSKLPILTHCQMGGHRGPTSAIFAAWCLAGMTGDALGMIHSRALELHPDLARGRNYYRSTMEWCRQNCFIPS